MKVLWLSPRWPLPDNTGARKATMALLSELTAAAAELGLKSWQLQLVCLFENEEDLKTIASLEETSQTKDTLYLEKPKVLAGSNGLAYLLTRVFHPTMAFTLQKYTSRSLRAKMADWMRQRRFDFTVIDGLHGAAFMDASNSNYGKIIYRAHNVESELWRQLGDQEKNPLKKFILRLEHTLSQRFEKNLCQRSHQTFSVSDLDSEKFKELIPGVRVEALAIGAAIEAKPLPFSAGDETLQLLFVGRLDWEPNKKGLQWFFKEVWPDLCKSRSVHLTIVGSGHSEWLSSYQFSNLSFLGRVAELKEHYQKSHLTLIPLFMGSGTRVKAIESGNYGRSFLSTRIGVEGLPFEAGRDYLCAESAEEWKKLLASLNLGDAQTLGERVHAVTQNHFEKRALASKFLSSLQKGTP
jgi:glycosyltransferase involved in cell wall biosynthesis